MTINNEQFQKFFTTLDCYTGGFLVLRDHEPEIIEQGPKCVLCFKASKKLYKDLADYNAGATVEALRFAVTIKSLKSRIHSMRRNNDAYTTKT